MSLIELVVVMLVLGILAAAAGPRFANSIVQYRAQAAARRVAADLNFARRNAITTSTPRTVDFDLTNNLYTLAGIKDPDHPAMDYQVTLSNTGYPASVAAADFNGNPTVTFDIFGRPDSGGTVLVQAGSNIEAIAVDAESGKAAVQ